MSGRVSIRLRARRACALPLLARLRLAPSILVALALLLPSAALAREDGPAPLVTGTSQSAALTVSTAGEATPATTPATLELVGDGPLGAHFLIGVFGRRFMLDPDWGVPQQQESLTFGLRVPISRGRLFLAGDAIFSNGAYLESPGFTEDEYTVFTRSAELAAGLLLVREDAQHDRYGGVALSAGVVEIARRIETNFGVKRTDGALAPALSVEAIAALRANCGGVAALSLRLSWVPANLRSAEMTLFGDGDYSVSSKSTDATNAQLSLLFGGAQWQPRERSR